MVSGVRRPQMVVVLIVQKVADAIGADFGSRIDIGHGVDTVIEHIFISLLPRLILGQRNKNLMERMILIRQTILDVAHHIEFLISALIPRVIQKNKHLAARMSSKKLLDQFAVS